MCHMVGARNPGKHLDYGIRPEKVIAISEEAYDLFRLGSIDPTNLIFSELTSSLSSRLLAPAPPPHPLQYTNGAFRF